MPHPQQLQADRSGALACPLCDWAAQREDVSANALSRAALRLARHLVRAHQASEGAAVEAARQAAALLW